MRFFLYVFVVCCPADFSMLSWVQALTGGSDDWRCPQRTACLLSRYLHPWAHLVRQENRSSVVVAGQWELGVLLLACWAACTKDGGSSVVFKNGQALIPCPACDGLVSHAAEEESGSGVLHCRSPSCWRAHQPFPVLHSIAKSTFNMACNVARRAAGGVRGYPLLRGLRTRLQLPVLHCTGNLSKMVVLFILACLPAEVSVSAKQNILAMTAKGKVESLYLREFRDMVASVVACPAVFSSELDPVFFLLLQLVQIVNAGWRSSLTDTDATQRAASAATTRLAASILGPLFEEVKPMDPETKNKKVVNLYLHAPIAHLHHQVAGNRSPVAYVSDDNIEGHIRAIGRYLHNNANNASQAALFSDLLGLHSATLNFSTPRSHPSSLIFTKFIRVCNCWSTLGPDGPADYAALRSIATDEACLAVRSDDSSDSLLVELPLHDRVDDNGERRRDASGRPVLGKKEAVRRGLRRAQHTITACICGKLSRKSPVMGLLRQRQSTERAGVNATQTGPSLRVPRRAGAGFFEGGASPGIPSESDAGSGTDGGPASSAEEASNDDGSGCGLLRIQSRRHTQGGIFSAMAAVVPPLSMLGQLFDDPAVYATVCDLAAAAPPVPEMAACVRKHIFVMETFLLRTRTASFMDWALTATVDRHEMVEAAEHVLSRLIRLRNTLLPADAIMAIA